jgi:two-component system, chemotaxis family, sensor kinase CheA
MSANPTQDDKNKVLTEFVLIVDDEEDLRDLFVEQVQAAGFKTITAANGAEALEKLRYNSCFLVLSDYLMPVMNGLELARRIRDTSPFIPIVLISGFGDKTLLTQAIKVGVTDFIDKPLSMTDLGTLVNKFADARRMELERELLEMDTLRQIFVEEAQGVLVEVEDLVTKMADSAPGPNELDLLFRKIHTIKGSAGTIGSATNLVKLAHIFETVLSHMKDGKLSLTGPLQATMLASVDAISSCVTCLAKGTPLPDTLHLQTDLANFAGNRAPSGGVVSATKTAAAEKTGATELAEDGLVVSTAKLESLKELAGELVAFKNTFSVFLKQNGDHLGVLVPEFIDMDTILCKITDSLQSEITDAQQVPLAKTFGKFPRIVRQVSGEVKKQIKLNLIGQEMTVDRIVSRELGDALIHAVRNSCDHGIELPEKRVASGKLAQGTITIKGSMIGEMITIEVQDDGGGLNRDRILAKAIEKKMITESESKDLPDGDVWDMLFLPNFSTAAQVSNLSGRGVGMDVVKTVALKFGGSAWFETVLGQSTKLTIQFPIPRSLVVEKSIIATAGTVTLAIPLSAITEICTVPSDQMAFLKPFWTFQHRGATVPVGSYVMFVDDKDVSREERLASSTKKTSLVAILQYQGKNVGLQLDAIIDQLEAVIRPFNDVVGKISGFRGVSRLPGDGVAYVVSPEEAIRNVYDLSKYNNRQASGGL